MSAVLTPWIAQSSAGSMPSIERARGSYLYADDGTRYLDLSAGLVAVNLGHGHPRVVEAIREQASELCYVSPQFRNAKREAAAQRLSAIAPWSEGCRTFFTTGGGEANEDAVKMARVLTGRHKVLAAYRSFHGSASGAGSLTGENRRWANEPGMPGVVRFFAPFPYRSPFFADDPHTETARALEHLDLTIAYEGSDRIAALVIEPVVGTNGAIVYSDGYLAGLRERCTRHGIVLIFDEVMCGFGRTGAAFGAQRFGVEPDMITFAKGVTSAYVPLGGVLVRERLAACFDDKALPCGHTFSGHPLAMAAACAALDAYRDEGIFERARMLETWLSEGLHRVRERASCVGDARGIGGFFAVELVRDRATKEHITPWQGSSAGHLPSLLAELRRHGVYAFGRYNLIMVTPPLTIEREDLDFGLDALAAVLEKYDANAA